jgi:N-acetylglucosaminyldiphosphoundecaprenol N-acetyl-beta-D-mannosaminyltransferase
MQANLSASQTARAPIAILGVPFDNVNLAETLALAGEMIASGQPHYATTVGVDFLAAALDDVELRRILFDAHLVVAEEKAVVWASKLLGNPLPDNVIVPNLLPQLLAQAEKKNWRVFFLGHDAAMAGKIQARHPKLQLGSATVPPEKPLLEMDHADILRRLREAKPEILLVAFGSPKQEKWINMNYREAGVPFVLGTGTTFDFLTGGRGAHKSTIKSLWKFTRAVLRQWWQLRARKKSAPPPAAAPAVEPDPFGNFVIHAPEQLGAVEVKTFLAEWLRAVENSHVMFDLSGTVFMDSTGIGVLIRLRKRARERGHQFFLVAPRPPIEAALRQMKLDEFFTVQASVAGARILMESVAHSPVVTSGVLEAELQIRWSGEVTALTAIDLGVHTESELSQTSPGMTVVIDLSRVTFVDSTGIGLMLRFKKNLRRRDIALTFANPIESVRNVLRHTRLEEYLLAGTK